MMYRIAVVNEDKRPLAGVDVEAIDLDNFPAVLDMQTTDRAGSATFVVANNVFFRPRIRRTSATVGDRIFTGNVQVQTVAIGGGNMNADMVVDSNGNGTHLSLFDATTGAFQEAVASGVSKFIWVCTTHQETTAATVNFTGLLAADQNITIASGVHNRAIIHRSFVGTAAMFTFTGASTVSSHLTFRNIGFGSAVGTGPFMTAGAGGPTIPHLEFDGCGFLDEGTQFSAVFGDLTACTVQTMKMVHCDGDGAKSIANLGATSSSIGDFIFDDNTMQLETISDRQNSSNSAIDWATSAQSHIQITNNTLDISVYAWRRTYNAPMTVSGNNIRYSGATSCFGFGTGAANQTSMISCTGNTFVADSAGASFCTIESAALGAKNIIITGNSLQGPGSGTAIIVIVVGTATSIELWPNSYDGWTTNIDDTGPGAATPVGPYPSGGGPVGSTADVLIGTANANYPSAIVVGATPNGELGGTWAAITVDTIHSGSAHHAESHASRHAENAADELDLGNLASGSATNGYVPTADGAGGVDWLPQSGSGGTGGGGLVTLFADPVQVTWINQPAALTELFGGTVNRTRVDLGTATTVRLVVRVETAGVAGSKLRGQYSTDEATWFYLDGATGPEVAIDAVGVQISTTVNLDAGAQADVYLRVIGIDGDGAVDPAFGVVMLQFDAIGGGTAVAPPTSRYVLTQTDAALTNSVVRQFLANYYNETYPGSANAMDDEFDDSSGMSGTGNGLNARWTWRNQSTATATYAKQGYVSIAVPSSAGLNLRGIEQTTPGTDYTVEAKISIEGVSATTTRAGIALIDSAGGDLYYFCLELATSAPGSQISIGRYNSVSSFNSFNFSPTQWGPTTAFLRVVYISGTTTLEFWLSSDGIGWTRMASFVDAVGHNRIGLFVNENNSTGLTVLHCDYFRRTA